MTYEERLKIVLDEEKFPYEGMSIDERNYYLNIINHCKDICDSNFKIDGSSTCNIVEMRFIKNKKDIHVNGSLEVGDKVKEYRCIDADIYIEKNRVIVDMVITRLCTKDKIKEYTVLDEFYIENDELKRRSFYNCDMKSIYSSIDNEEMKGRLK